jgi:hypothetical protein
LANAVPSPRTRARIQAGPAFVENGPHRAFVRTIQGNDKIVDKNLFFSGNQQQKGLKARRALHINKIVE